MQHGACNLPVFDFTHHRPLAETRPIELRPDAIAVVELNKFQKNGLFNS